MNERDAAFAEVKRTKNLLGAFDVNCQYRCPFDHEKMWKDGFDAGYAHAAAWVPIRAAEDLPKEAGDYLVQQWIPADDYEHLEPHLEVGIEYFDNGVWVCVSKDYQPVAWMPIPAYVQESAQEDAVDERANRED